MPNSVSLWLAPAWGEILLEGGEGGMYNDNQGLRYTKTLSRKRVMNLA